MGSARTISEPYPIYRRAEPRRLQSYNYKHKRKNDLFDSRPVLYTPCADLYELHIFSTANNKTTCVAAQTNAHYRARLYRPRANGLAAGMLTIAASHGHCRTAAVVTGIPSNDQQLTRQQKLASAQCEPVLSLESRSRVKVCKAAKTRDDRSRP